MHRNHKIKDDELTGKIFFGKYKPEKKLGEGSFGKIYSAVNVTDGENYALKMESKEGGQNLLESEAYFLCYLKGYGIPSVKSYGFSGNYNIMVMELLGKSLEELFQECKKKLSLKTVCFLAQQMLDRMEFIHNKHIIHRDIKPDNFVMGLNNKSDIVYILDFGLAKKYRSSRTLQHIKFNINKKLTGTARYASINALRGCEQSRRDDLEAIGYVLMYFLRGSLPWQGLKVDRKEDRYKKIYEKKKSTTPEELCSGFPPELAEYVRYTRNLEFEQNPDYNYLRGLFRKILEDKGYDISDVRFDWSKDIKNKENNILNKVNFGKNNFEVNYDEKEKDMQINNNDIVNKHLITNNNFEDSNINKKRNNGERVNTQFANYNTTVQITDNANNAFQIGDDKNLNKNANNFEGIKGNNDRFGQTGNDNLKKKKKGKDKCYIF
jgi:serine/threonine protein kinase